MSCAIVDGGAWEWSSLHSGSPGWFKGMCFVPEAEWTTQVPVVGRQARPEKQKGIDVGCRCQPWCWCLYIVGSEMWAFLGEEWWAPSTSRLSRKQSQYPVFTLCWWHSLSPGMTPFRVFHSDLFFLLLPRSPIQNGMVLKNGILGAHRCSGLLFRSSENPSFSRSRVGRMGRLHGDGGRGKPWLEYVIWKYYVILKKKLLH